MLYPSRERAPDQDADVIELSLGILGCESCRVPEQPIGGLALAELEMLYRALCSSSIPVNRHGRDYRNALAERLLQAQRARITTDTAR
jgi:hypothetical protein